MRSDSDADHFFHIVPIHHFDQNQTILVPDHWPLRSSSRPIIYALVESQIDASQLVESTGSNVSERYRLERLCRLVGPEPVYEMLKNDDAFAESRCPPTVIDGRWLVCLMFFGRNSKYSRSTYALHQYVVWDLSPLVFNTATRDQRLVATITPFSFSPTIQGYSTLPFSSFIACG